jgi:hypothetical protein
MPARASRGCLRRIVAFAFVALLLLGEVLVLDFTPLDRINSQPSAQREQRCGFSEAESASLVGAARYYGCATIFKNLRFIDNFHDTINAISTLLVAIFTFTLWRSTNKLSDASDRQLRHSEMAFTAQNRAWLKIDLIPFREIAFRNDGGFDSQITVRITNIGGSPAKDVGIRIRPFIAFTPSSEWADRAKHSLLRRMANRHPAECGRVILPGESIELEPDLAMRSDEIRKSGIRPFILRVAAVARYQTGGLESILDTLSYFDVTRISDSGISNAIIESEVLIPKERIMIRKAAGGIAT